MSAAGSFKKQPPVRSDGTPKWHPNTCEDPEVTIRLASNSVLHAWLRSVQLISLPKGYLLFSLEDEDERWYILCGHPSGARFTSPSAFKPHLQWLYNWQGVCACELCDGPSLLRPVPTGNMLWKHMRPLESTVNCAGLPFHLRPGANDNTGGYVQWTPPSSDVSMERSESYKCEASVASERPPGVRKSIASRYSKNTQTVGISHRKEGRRLPELLERADVLPELLNADASAKLLQQLQTEKNSPRRSSRNRKMPTLFSDSPMVYTDWI